MAGRNKKSCVEEKLESPQAVQERLRKDWRDLEGAPVAILYAYGDKHAETNVGFLVSVGISQDSKGAEVVKLKEWAGRLLDFGNRHSGHVREIPLDVVCGYSLLEQRTSVFY